LQQVEVATKIRGKYLRQIEGDDSHLPNDVYTRGFVQSYGNYLGLDGKTLARRYGEERGDVISHAAARVKPIRSRRLVFTPQVAIVIGIVAGLGAVAAYLVWQFSALAAAPSLDVSQPKSDQVLYGSLLDIKGKTTPGADVLVNDSPILSDSDGNFTDQLALQDGVNTVRITAKNHLGKTTTVTRNILAHVDTAKTAASFPVAVFDGIAISITVKDSPTAITVRVDDKEVFKGTMLPGTSQVFKGATKISIDTSNGGVTSITLTNSTVAGKQLGTVGGSGEQKTDLEFAKDTQFP
jgi:cytoskeletal protein RodZ